MTLQLIVFIVLALFIAVCSVLAVTHHAFCAQRPICCLYYSARQAFTSSSIIRFWEPSNC